MTLGSSTAENVALAGIYGNDKGSTAPTSLTWRLWDGDPNAGGAEITGTGYAAVVMANTTTNLGTPSGGQLGPVIINFGVAGADDWVEPFYIACDDGSGNLFNVQEISNPAIVNSGDPVDVTTSITAT